MLAVLFLLGPVLFLWKWLSLEASAAQGRRDLEVALAETDALDPRWRWEHLEEDRPDVPAERNSIPVVLKIDGLLAGLNHARDGLFPRGKNFPGDLPPNRLLDDASLAHLARILAPREPAIPLARSLRDFPEGHAPLTLRPGGVTYPGHHYACEKAAWLLAIDCERLLGESRTHAAADSIHAILHVGAGLRGEPLVDAQKTRINIRAVAVRAVERLLGMSEPDDATLARLQAHLTAEAAERPVLAGLRGERALLYRRFESLRSGELSLADKLGAASASGFQAAALRVTAWMGEYGLTGEEADWLERFNQEIALVEFTPREQEARRKALPSRWKRPTADVFLLMEMMHKRDSAAEAGPWDRGRLTCGLAALAVERFRRAKQRWPENLAELVPAYLPAVPLDPYTEQPLSFRALADGVILYCAPRDWQGTGTPPPPREDERSFRRAVRLWDAPHRRLPPIPLTEVRP
jgi:hypothetical protein